MVELTELFGYREGKDNDTEGDSGHHRGKESWAEWFWEEGKMSSVLGRWSLRSLEDNQMVIPS